MFIRKGIDMKNSLENYDIFHISTYFITDKDTELDNIGTEFFRLRKVIFGTTWTLTIKAPKDGLHYIEHHAIPTGSTRYAQALKHGARGEISLYKDGKQIVHKRTRYPIAPVSIDKDNIIQEKLRKFFNRDFFDIVYLAKMRQQGKIILRDNPQKPYDTIFTSTKQKTK